MRYDEQEALFRKIASTYADTYGSELKKQLGEAEGLDTRQLDIKVRRKMSAKKRRSIYTLGALAACLFLILSSRFFPVGDNAGAPQSAGNEAQSSYDMIYLSFELPEGFSVNAKDQDHGKTIYYLENTGMDDVILTAELSEGSFESAGLTELEINHSRAYAASSQGVNVLAFEKDGVLYTLSCRHDINTLITLGREII